STAAATKTPDTWRSSRGYDVVRTQTRISDVRRCASSVLRRRQLQLVRRLVLQRKLEPANADEHAFEEPAIRCQQVAEDADHDYPQRRLTAVRTEAARRIGDVGP